MYIRRVGCGSIGRTGAANDVFDTKRIKVPASPVSLFVLMITSTVASAHVNGAEINFEVRAEVENIFIATGPCYLLFYP